jgi:hypothetical protein
MNHEVLLRRIELNFLKFSLYKNLWNKSFIRNNLCKILFSIQYLKFKGFI